MKKIPFFLLLSFFLFSLFAPFSSQEINFTLANLPPSSSFLFGTDDLGRDLLTRVLQGMRISFFVGFFALSIDLTLGISVGCLSSILGGKIDEIVMRLCNALTAIPFVLTMILCSAFLGSGLMPIFFVWTLSGWVPMAMVVRTQILGLKQQEFVLSARALGLPSRLILVRHILPNARGAIIGALTLSIPHAIFAESFLSFLGLGIQPPLTSLGGLVGEGLGALRFYPWRFFLPAGVLSLAMLSFHLLGDMLRDATDPRISC